MPQPPSFTLDQLLQLTEQGSPLIQAKQGEARAAQADAEAQAWQKFPTLEARTRSNGTTDVSLTQPLWTWGRLEESERAAQERSGAARVGVDETRHTLQLRVVDLWRQYLAAQARMDIGAQGLRILHRHLEAAVRRHHQGGYPKSDVALVQQRIQALRADVRLATSQAELALTALQQILGQRVDIAQRYDALPALKEAVLFPSDPQELLQRASQHPAVLKAEREAAAIKHEASATRAAQWPYVVGRLEHLQQDMIGVGTVTDNRAYLALEFTPGAGLGALSKTQAAEQRAAAALQQRQQALLEVQARMLSAWQEWAELDQRVPLLRQQVQQTAEVLSSFERQFLVGRRGWLEVLNALRDNIQTQIALAEAEVARAAAWYKLILTLNPSELP